MNPEMMIKRLVKLTFQDKKVEDFLAVFAESRDHIRAFPGCRHLELLCCPASSNVFFTLSIWQAEADLEAYRQSDLFRSTWARTKVLFAAPAEAWTLELVAPPAGPY